LDHPAETSLVEAGSRTTASQRSYRFIGPRFRDVLLRLLSETLERVKNPRSHEPVVTARREKALSFAPRGLVRNSSVSVENLERFRRLFVPDEDTAVCRSNGFQVSP
jgi:hypothetical protein